MRISINCGHTVSGAGYGAVSGGFKESQITRAVGNELIRLLRKEGHTVYNSTVNYASSQNAYLQRVVEMVNRKDAELFVSLHCNASSKHTANGVEVKDGSKLYVVRNTNPPAMLVEMFFLDNRMDQNLYKEIGCKGIAKMIADSIALN